MLVLNLNVDFVIKLIPKCRRIVLFYSLALVLADSHTVRRHGTVKYGQFLQSFCPSSSFYLANLTELTLS